MRSVFIWGVLNDLWVLTVGRYTKRGMLETRSALRRQLTVENALVLPLIHPPNRRKATISIKFNVSSITYILHIQDGAILDTKQATNIQQNMNLLRVSRICDTAFTLIKQTCIFGFTWTLRFVQ